MSKLPEHKVSFEIPEGYFEDLPEKIMAKLEPKPDYSWYKWAAAALILISLGIYQLDIFQSQDEYLAMEEEVELYIESNYWTAEDILGMTENPEEILNEIILEETPFSQDLWETEDQNLFDL
ncbi:hypothetical protein [Algoriphagus sp. CAU 1675]|uniref:hypothetical protein n=1 Tax=Algoriphagus sp. CAU 1675 TaxID=3032597 RepID=UPI0023D98B14|nr:hypothetical protein [Algoriphagus sp. CAU 1675]MDF2158092.1 hypothetical protein [Algoriphagus sp. CAU 1675]